MLHSCSLHMSWLLLTQILIPLLPKLLFSPPPLDAHMHCFTQMQFFLPAPLCPEPHQYSAKGQEVNLNANLTNRGTNIYTHEDCLTLFLLSFSVNFLLSYISIVHVVHSFVLLSFLFNSAFCFHCVAFNLPSLQKEA